MDLYDLVCEIYPFMTYVFFYVQECGGPSMEVQVVLSVYLFMVLLCACVQCFFSSKAIHLK